MEDYKTLYEQRLERAKEEIKKCGYNKGRISMIENIFPELKENEDERIRNFLISKMKEVGNVWKEYSSKDIIAWLEKQAEQKPIRPVWKYKKDNTPLLRDSFILNKYGCVAKSPSGALVSDVWVLDFDELAKLPKEEFEKQGEQKPADKIEPKFRVGDWVVQENIGVYKIVEICKSWYEVIDFKEHHYSISFNNENMCHLWTIQDAKDGDVLATDNDGICIFDGTVEEGIYPFAYCGLTRYGFESYDRKLPFTHDNNVYPATKEQCDLLFKKMKEAGYEWDAEKKELKKIKQKTTKLPNGEDYGIDSLYHAARILEKTLGDVDGYQSDDGILEHKCAIEAVNRLYKQKSTWSEEDESMLQNILECLKNGWSKLPTDILKYESWLKSIKERYTWKPSDEQIEALLKLEEMHVLEHEKNQENAHLYMVIKSLKEQLWKLKKGE